MASMQTDGNGMNPMSQEPLRPEDRKRDAGMPCGLKNIGNTCYFNSILQVYYNIPEFVEAIFKFQVDTAPLPPFKPVLAGS
jgi:ubiquitin C-terminal hydrolase